MGRRPSIVLCLALLAATAGATAATAAAPAPVEAAGTAPRQSGARLAPGGTLVAWQERSGADTRVVVYALDSNQVKRSFAIDRTMQLRSLRWADDDTLLATVSSARPAADGTTGRTEYVRTLALDPATGTIRMLLMGDGLRSLVTGATLVAVHTAKPKTVIMATLDFDAATQPLESGTARAAAAEDPGWVSTLFAVDTGSGKGVVLERGSPATEQWLVDAAGHAVARGDFDRAGHRYTLRARTANGWQELYRRTDGKGLELCGLSRDGSAIVAIGEAAGRAKLLALPLDGAAARVLVEDPARDVTGVLRDPASDRLVGATVGGPDRTTRWLDADAEREAGVLARAFPGRTTELIDRSGDGRKLLVRVAGTSTAPTYYLVDYATHRADIVAEE
jgi:dipeptidyl aminopeptidase/acylaminoacyl peptidase